MAQAIVAPFIVFPCSTQILFATMSKALFEQMKEGIKTKGPEMVKMGGAIFQFDIGNGAADFGENPKADCTITISDADFVAMSEGKLDGMQAFMGGKLKIKGNMMLAQKLAGILEAVRN